MSATPASVGFDVPAAVRRTLQVFWDDFAPIVILGFLFVTLPGILIHVTIGATPAAGEPGYQTVGTFVQVATTVLVMLFASAVSYGVVSTLFGRRLDPTAYMRIGIAAARPGLLAALVIGAAAMMGFILLLLARALPLGWLLQLGIIAAMIWLLVTWLVAIPVAVAERLQPLDALRRSADLTRGSRWRLLGLLAVAALALLPAAMLVNLVVFGPYATPQTAELLLARMGIDHPGLWIEALFELLAFGLLACLPPVVYSQLVGRH